VHHGETLSGIAARYGTSVWAIANANGLHNPNYIRAGTCLTIPYGGGGYGGYYPKQQPHYGGYYPKAEPYYGGYYAKPYYGGQTYYAPKANYGYYGGYYNYWYGQPAYGKKW
jgi:hypothetical protein